MCRYSIVGAETGTEDVKEISVDVVGWRKPAKETRQRQHDEISSKTIKKSNIKDDAKIHPKQKPPLRLIIDAGPSDNKINPWYNPMMNCKPPSLLKSQGIRSIA
jgi:hypothetical protein